MRMEKGTANSSGEGGRGAHRFVSVVFPTARASFPPESWGHVELSSHLWGGRCGSRAPSLPGGLRAGSVWNAQELEALAAFICSLAASFRVGRL